MVRILIKKSIPFFIVAFFFIPLISLSFNLHSNVLSKVNTSNKVASISDNIDLALLPAINNSWYDPKIEMLIISPNKPDLHSIENFIDNIYTLFTSIYKVYIKYRK